MIVAAAVAAALLHYDVTAGGGARELSVEAQIPAFPDRAGELSVNDGAEPFVRDVAILSAGVPVAVERRGDSWFAPQCAAHGCRIRYRFALREAADALDDEDRATAYGEVLESPPGTWLLRPLQPPAGATAELNVSTPKELRFAAGLPQTLAASELGGLPYAAFGKLRVETIPLQGRSLTVGIARRQEEEELLAWIGNSAAQVAAYFGRFPVDRALLLVLPAPGEQVHGRTRGIGGASTLCRAIHSYSRQTLFWCGSPENGEPRVTTART